MTTKPPRTVNLIRKDSRDDQTIEPIQDIKGPEEKVDGSLVHKLCSYIDEGLNIQPFASPDGRMYARVHVGTHWEVHALSSPKFAALVRNVSWRKYRKMPNKATAENVILHAEGVASFDSGDPREVYQRIAFIGDKIYVDRTAADWSVFEINKEGWSIVQCSPVDFVRDPAAQPMVTPVSGGGNLIGEVGELFNLEEADIYKLLVFMFGAYWKPPYPSLFFKGLPRSGKTTMCRYLKALLDPTGPRESAPVLPKEEQVFWLRTEMQHIVFYDNMVSPIPPNIEQGLTMLSTGAEMPLRRYYSQALKNPIVVRPVACNSLVNLLAKPDHADRNLLVCPSQIPDGKQYGVRGAQENEWGLFDKVAPSLLGNFFSALSRGLREGDSLGTVEGTFRMAHSVSFTVGALGKDSKPQIEAALSSNHENKEEDIISNDLFLDDIVKWIETAKSWAGSKSDFFRNMVEPHAGSVGYPRSLRGVTEKLASNAKLLLHTRGIHVDLDCYLHSKGDRKTQRAIRFWLEGQEPPTEREPFRTYYMKPDSEEPEPEAKGPTQDLEQRMLEAARKAN